MWCLLYEAQLTVKTQCLDKNNPVFAARSLYYICMDIIKAKFYQRNTMASNKFCWNINET